MAPRAAAAPELSPPVPLPADLVSTLSAWIDTNSSALQPAGDPRTFLQRQDSDHRCRGSSPRGCRPTPASRSRSARRQREGQAPFHRARRSARAGIMAAMAGVDDHQRPAGIERARETGGNPISLAGRWQFDAQNISPASFPLGAIRPELRRDRRPARGPAARASTSSKARVRGMVEAMPQRVRCGHRGRQWWMRGVDPPATAIMARDCRCGETDREAPC